MFRRRRSDPGGPLEDDAPHAAIRAQLADVSGARRDGWAPILPAELPVVVGLAQLHADTVASLTMTAVRDGAPVRPTPPIVAQPDPDEAAGDTLHKIVQSLYWTGNAYALVTWPPSGRAPAIALKVLNPDTVSFSTDPDDPLRVAEWEVAGYRYPRSDVLHIKLNDDPRLGPLGRSPLTQCRATLDWHAWAQWYLGDFFASGGVPSSILKSGRRLTPQRAADALGEWTDARQARRPGIMGPDWELEVPAGPDHASTVTVLEEAVADVARALNVPPSLANAKSGGSLTYANVNDELRRWLALSLRPTWLARLERAWSRLLPRGTDAKFIDDALYRTPELVVPAASSAGDGAPVDAGVAG